MQYCKKPWKACKSSLLFRHRWLRTCVHTPHYHSKVIVICTPFPTILTHNVDHQDHFSVSDDLRDEGHTKLASDLRTMWKAEKQQSKEQRLCVRWVA